MKLNTMPLRLLWMPLLCLISLWWFSPNALAQGSTMLNVKDFGALANGSHDDTAAISSAVNSTLAAGSEVVNVYFPAGIYRISSTIALHSNMRIYGDGIGSVISQSPGLSVLQAIGTPSSPVSNIVVESLNFRGEGGFEKSYGLSVTCGRDITFQHNSANGLPLFNIACAGTSNQALLSSNVTVRDNTATGKFGEGAAIMLRFVVNATVSGNEISNYDHGIQYWGGDSATGESYMGVSKITISSNSVHNVGGGAIWGSEGSHIRITGNTTEGCGDVCLDAEASSDVSFSDNTVKNAVNGGIATFFGSTNIVISANSVMQDAAFQNPKAHPNGSYAAIHIHGGNKESNRVSSKIKIVGNTLDVSGISSAITTDQGTLENSMIQYNTIMSSSSTAAAIRILGGSRVDILDNKISSMSPTGISIEGPSRSVIANNVIANHAGGLPLDASKGGIHIYWRSASEPAQYNQVRGNTITGFPISINDDCWGDSASFNTIEDNSVDTIYYRGNAGSYKGIVVHNSSNSGSGSPVTGTSY